MSATPESDEESSSNEVSPTARMIGLVILATFGWLAFFALVTAGGIFFTSFGKSPNPETTSLLWSLFAVGTVSAFCASWLHHWIKNLKMQSITINL